MKAIINIEFCVPNIEDLKKAIRAAAKEKNDPIFASILSPAGDVQNKEKAKNKPPASQKTKKFAGLTTFPGGSVQGQSHELDPNSSDESSVLAVKELNLLQRRLL